MGIVAPFKKIRELSLNNDYNTNDIRFAKHHAFMFLLYDFINRHHSSLGYHLLTKTRFWEETHAKVDFLSLLDLKNAVAEIKITGMFKSCYSYIGILDADSSSLLSPFFC